MDQVSVWAEQPEQSVCAGTSLGWERAGTCLASPDSTWSATSAIIFIGLLLQVGVDPVKDWNLEISAAQIDDEGEYQCQVLASPGNPSMVSSTGRLLVAIPSGPPHISGGPELSLEEGREVEVECEARGGRPAVQLDWQLGQLSLRDVQTSVEKIPGSVTFLTRSLVKVLPRREDDGAELQCRSSATGLESMVARVSVRVQYAPQVSH